MSNQPTFKQIKKAVSDYNNNATRNGLTHTESRAARRGTSGAVIVALILIAAAIALTGCSSRRPVSKIETTPNRDGTWSKCTHYADERAPVVSCQIVTDPHGVNWSSRHIQ